MLQEMHSFSHDDKFLSMHLEANASSNKWLQVWSRQLPEFQRSSIRNREIKFLSILNGIGAPLLVDASVPYGAPANNIDLKLSSSCSLWLPTIPIETLSAQDKLQLAIAITKAVSQLHQADIFHFSLRPGCFLVNESFNSVEIIGFSEAKYCSKQSQGIASFLPLTVNPHFLSPEQSYLHNRLIDNCCDLYSLGCILYWLFSGHEPFSELSETIDINYAHMSRRLVLPTLHWPQKNQEAGLAEIISTLLEKEPDKRYQSSAGILADLQALATLKPAVNFSIRAQDTCDRMVIPQRLYGREKEIELLMSAYSRVEAGHSEALLIGGYSGVGKSALVDEIRVPIMQKNGLFISGKFEQYQRETPYSAIAQAFSQFINSILSYSESEVSIWKIRLEKALGNNAQIIIDIIPSLALLLEDVPTPQPLGADEQQNRFNRVFLSFMHQICLVHKPLVLFIDDLQWADTASINLLKLILTDKRSQHCFIVGAYRDNEVDERHPFVRMLQEVDLLENNLNKIQLNNLNYSVITKIVSDTLKKPDKEAQKLAQLVYEKTAGNPFFFRQFLFELFCTNLLNFQYDALKWQWSIEEIELQSISDNVVDLVTIQLDRLALPSINLLRQAACVESTFTTDYLTGINNLTFNETKKILKECVDAGLIRSISERSHHNPTTTLKYKFVHDRVQQAAYAKNSIDERQDIHYKIGSLLLDKTSECDYQEHCFEIASHLNIAKNLLSSSQIRTVISINYIAAQKAKSATAYDTAISYLDNVISYENEMSKLKKQEEIDHSTLASIEKLECLYLSGEYDQAELFKDTVISLCSSLDLKVQLAGILITQFTRYGHLQRAIDKGLETLTLLSSPLPCQPTETNIASEIEYCQALLSQSGFEKISQKKDIHSKQILFTLDILMAMQPCCYNSGSLLFPLTILSLFKLTCENGNSAYSSYVFMMYALLSTKALKAYPQAFEAAKYSRIIAKRYPPNPILEGRLLMMNSNFVLPWQKKLQLSHEMRNQAYDLCLENGDYYWGVHAYIFGFYADLIGSPSITKLLKRSQSVVATCELIKQPAQTYLSTLQCNFLEILQGSLENLENLDHQPGYEEKALQHFNDHHYMCGHYDRLLARLIQGYLFNNYQQALSISLNPNLGPEQIDEGIFHEAVYTLFNLLCILALKQKHPDSILLHHQNWFKLGWKKYQNWYQMNPDNFETGYFLISAEIAAVNHNEIEALCFYEKSIMSASKSEFALYQALACERSGLYRLQIEQVSLATGYLQQAQALYHSWGAHAKAIDIEDTLRNIDQSVPSLSSHQLNWESVITASQDISTHLSRKELHNRMLQKAATITGAQHIALYRKKEGEWCLSSLCIQGIVKEVFSQSELSPISILNYCLNSQKTVVLKDAYLEGDFILDDYICQNKVRSVLSMPLQVQGNIVGILYLEHNSTSNLFSGQRRQAMELLKNQFAITYQNTDLFLQLEQQNEILENTVTHRTKDLNRKNKHLESVLNALPIPYVLSKPSGEFVDANDLFFEFFEVTRSEFESSTVLDFYQHAADRERMLTLLEKNEVIEDFECEMKTFSGKPFWAQFSVTRVDFESGSGMFTAIKDISGHKRKEILLEHQATTDPLTGAYNRRGFEELSQALVKDVEIEKVCVVMLDLDQFKVLNDTYGHAAGDEVLKQFSSNLQSHLRDQDILGRVGGEEFSVILSNLSLSEAHKVMERICQLTSQIIVLWQGKKISFTVSIGLSAWRKNEPLREAYKRADQALYDAKAGGRNCVKLA